MDNELQQGGVTFGTYRAAPESGSYPGLVLIHEIWGLNENIRDIAIRFARHGFTVLAPDLLSDSGLQDILGELWLERQDPEKMHAAQAKMREATAPVRTKEFAEKAIARLRLCVDTLLKDEQVNGAVGAVGFCFGGTYTFHLAIHDDRLRAAVPFYGQPPESSNVARIKCPVYALYGKKDEALMETLPALAEAMQTAGRDFTYEVYEGAGHAFFNDTNKIAFVPEAADDAWEKVLAFLHQNLDEVI